jgi:hypothetical protein
MALKFCPHCGYEIAERTFRRHKSIFYNEETKSWQRNNVSGVKR